MPIRLHKFGDAWGLPDGSPFCLKLEGFLREAAVPYEVVPFDFSRSFRKAPKGKLPFIEDEDGTVVGDSSLIIARLSRRHGIDLDGGLDPRQRANSHAFRRMLDEHLYWVAVFSRWMEDVGWKTVQKTFFSAMPALLRPVATTLARRQVAAALQAQGLGRHSREEIYTPSSPRSSSRRYPRRCRTPPAPSPTLSATASACRRGCSGRAELPASLFPWRPTSPLAGGERADEGGSSTTSFDILPLHKHNHNATMLSG